MTDIPRTYPVEQDGSGLPSATGPYRDEAGQWVGAKNLCFGTALGFLKAGHPVTRAGWNGRGMFIVMMPRLELPAYSTQGTDRKVNDRTAKWIGVDTPLDCNPYVAMWTADKKWQPGWLCSQTDMFAEDWMLYEGIPTQGELLA